MSEPQTAPSPALRLAALHADITTLAVDAIVNAANSSLLGGGGVDGAIHRECRLLGGCRTGQAKATRGHRLPARHVIHTVGPVWQGGHAGEAELLASCYAQSLVLAEELALRSLAFPAISTGVYRFPSDLAAAIAVRTVAAHAPRSLESVVFCCFSAADLSLYENLLEGRA
jgi:O-acetyl-ADP-ribose deacetylase (regulator of RNase III)